MSEESRLRWQCRRGMRELDELLVRYLETRYTDADDEEKAAFQAVLALPDPELNGYLLQRQVPDSDAIANVIKLILSHPHT
jgi:antitoxin CptB